MNLSLMKPKKTDTILPTGNRIYEIKYDGGSAVLEKKAGLFQVFHGGNPNPVTYKYPELQAASVTLRDGVYVAELCVLDHGNAGGYFPSYLKRQCENRFQITLRTKTYPITAMVHDIVEHEGHSCTHLPLSERKKLISYLTGSIIHSVPFWDNPDPVLSLKDSLEGIVIKDLDTPYLFGKRNSWYKFRFNKEETVRFVSYEEWAKKTGEEGLVLITKEGRRVTLSGPRIHQARESMEEKGYVLAEISYNGKTDNGFRFTTVKRIL